DEPHGEKPHPQRLARVLQHSSSRQRYLPIAGSTAQQASRHFPRLAHCRAVGASHPASEAAGYIPGTPARCQTTRRAPETSEDNQSQRRDALAAFHPSTLSGVPTCVKGIPTFANCCAVSRHTSGRALAQRSSPILPLVLPRGDKRALSGYAGGLRVRPAGFGCSTVPARRNLICRAHVPAAAATDRRSLRLFRPLLPAPFLATT